MIIAGIDPSLKGTAVVVGDGDGHPESRVFASHRIDDSVVGRFRRYENQIANVMDFLDKWQPKEVYIEGYVFGKWDVTPITEYGAMLRWNLLEFGKVHEVSPSTVKKFACGHGGSKQNPVQKPQVMEALKAAYGVDFFTDDEYDAYAVWRIGGIAEGILQPTRPFELECVKSVTDPPQKSRQKSKPRKPRSPGTKAK